MINRITYDLLYSVRLIFRFHWSSRCDRRWVFCSQSTPVRLTPLDLYFSIRLVLQPLEEFRAALNPLSTPSGRAYLQSDGINQLRDWSTPCPVLLFILSTLSTSDAHCLRPLVRDLLHALSHVLRLGEHGAHGSLGFPSTRPSRETRERATGNFSDIFKGDRLIRWSRKFNRIKKRLTSHAKCVKCNVHVICEAHFWKNDSSVED